MIVGLEVIAITYVASKIYEFFRDQKDKIKMIPEVIMDDATLNNDIAVKKDDVVSEHDKTLDHYAKMSGVSLVISGACCLIANVPPLFVLGNIFMISYVSIPIIRQAEKSLIKDKKIKNDLLNAIVITGAIATGAYFTASLINLVYHFGSILLAKTRLRSEKILTNIFEKQPVKAWILKDNIEVEFHLDDIRMNDIVVVNTGEIIPVDGYIDNGEAMIDQHILTGESVPAEKKKGDHVFAATLVLSGRINIKVEKSGSDTVAAKISKTLYDMMNFKTRRQLRGEIWADNVAPPLLILGGLSLPFLSFSSSLAVLYASPGNIYRFCGSLLTLNYLIVASKRGILIKDGAALEEFIHIDTIIFDKTGTLTENEPRVGQIIPYHINYNEKDILSYALVAEYKMTHPIAKAILKKAKEWGLYVTNPDDSEYKVGYGIRVSFDNKMIRVGSLSFLKMEGIQIDDRLKKKWTAPYDTMANSLVFVAIDNDVAGAIEIVFQVRPEVKKVVNGLRRRGINHISILSGDTLEPTRRLSESIGADTYFHGILPEDKARIVEQYQKEGRKVCFVGDGINDAIAMKKADVSISLRGASTVATDMAQVILMDGTLSKLCDLIDISIGLDSSLRQNISTSSIAAVGYGSIFLFYLNVGLVPSILFSVFLLSTLLVHAMLPLSQITFNDKEENERIAYDDDNKG
jgi:Cu2+-exporting ATPase